MFVLEKTEPCLAEACLRMFHLCFGLSDHLKALLDFVFGSRRRVKKVRIFRAWFSHLVLPQLTPVQAAWAGEDSVELSPYQVVA